MTSKQISYYLENNYFRNGCKFIIPNIYYFNYGCETDLLVIKSNGSVYDIEIKISRSDYKADFKKLEKHEIYRTGGIIYKRYQVDYISSGNMIKYNEGDFRPRDRPNRFYYAVPENLISVEELPNYAGLFYIYPDGSVKKIKEAKLLHKEKITNFEKIASKCYWMWKSQKPINKL